MKSRIFIRDLTSVLVGVYGLLIIASLTFRWPASALDPAPCFEFSDKIFVRPVFHINQVKKAMVDSCSQLQ
jgi:hypothetical protein